MKVKRTILLMTSVLCALVCIVPVFYGCTAETQAVPTPEAVAAPDGTEASVPAAGLVRGKVTDSNSQMLVAGIIVEDEAGNAYRAVTNAYGGYNLALQPGVYKLTFCKGAEYDTLERTVTVEKLKTYYQQDARLTKLNDSYAQGWIAGDTHQHTYYSDGVDSVESAMISNASAGLYWGFLTDHNNSRGVPEWTGASLVNVSMGEDGAARYFHGLDGVEVTTEFGHFNCLGSGLTLETYDLNLTETERSSQEKLDYIHENLEYIADCIRRVGGIAQINHPFSVTTMGVVNWVARDDYELFDLFDTIEVWNGYFVPPDGIFTTENSMNQNYSSKLLWYELLNQMRNGRAFHAAMGGTDNHSTQSAVSAEDRKILSQKIDSLEDYYAYWTHSGQYSGDPTTYVRTGGEITMQTVMEALKNGHSFVSSGPIVLCDIDGVTYGETLVPTDNELVLRTDIFNRDGISQIRIIVNGEAVTTITPEAGTTRYSDPITVSGEWAPHDWILIEVLGPLAQYAITNPIILG